MHSSYGVLILSNSDAFRKMLESIKTPYDECIEILLKNMKLDPYFDALVVRGLDTFKHLAEGITIMKEVSLDLLMG
jgi:hypothetical protein